MTLSSGSMSIGVLAIFSGLLGAYGLRAVLLAEPAPVPRPPATVVVPLATEDLPAGRMVRFGDIGIHQMTRQQMIERGFANPSVMLHTPQIMGRMLREPIRKGEPFQTTKMYLEGQDQNISEMLKPGMRAVTVEVPTKMGGFVDAGSCVDVLFRSRPLAESEFHAAIPETTVTLMSGIEVVYVETERRIENPNGGGLDLRRTNGRDTPVIRQPQVTLAVTLEQANMLRAVDGRGEIALVPRAMDSGDESVERPEPVTLDTLLGWGGSRGHTTEIYRGGSYESRRFGHREVLESYRQRELDEQAAARGSTPASDGSNWSDQAMR